MASWCEDKLSQLSNEEVRIPILKEMKDFLSDMPRDEISRMANVLELPPIFDCLNDSNSEQVDLACEVLSLCMSNLGFGESTNRYGSFLERALNHPYPGVKLMALSELQRNIENDDVLVDLCKRESLLVNIVQCVSHEDISVVKKASDIIVTLGLSSQGIQKITSPNMVKSFQDIMGSDEVVKMRVYEILVKISTQSDPNLKLITSTGLLSQLFEELNNNDVLLRLNVLELVSELGQCKHGYDYLSASSVLELISAMLDTDDSVTLQLCQPGILKFFGRMARCKPSDIATKYSVVMQKLFDNVEGEDSIILGVTLDTLGHIGLTNEGKIALDVIGEKTQQTIRNIARSLPSYTTEIKVRALNCLENLLRVVEYNTQVCIITQKWFNLLDDGDSMDFIWKYARNPFSEIRLAGFGVLNALAGQSWAQETIRNTPGLLEFLLDRNVEVIKDCKEAKYGIVEILSHSPAFDEQTRKKLAVFVKEGPFYVHTITEVALGNE